VSSNSASLRVALWREREQECAASWRFELSDDRVANCVVLHDWKDQLNQARWLDVALQFFHEIGSEPDVAQASDRPGRSRLLKPKTLEKRLAMGTSFSGISLYSRLPPYNDFGQWTAIAGNNVTGTRKKVIAFAYDSRGTGLEIGLLADLVYRLSSFVALTYGYGFQRPFSKGPEMYAYDLSYGLDERRPEDKAESDRMALWYQERLDLIVQNKPAAYRHLLGMQRDVYPLNVLTAPHLSRPIEGVSLERWIGADELRGRLHQIAPTVWTWVVPADQLSRVRAALEVAGLLICRPGRPPCDKEKRPS